MKNSNYIVNGVLAVAVIILFILQFTNKKGTDKGGVALAADSLSLGAKMPVAYVNTDSVLSNYNFAKDLQETMLKKVENSRASINQKQEQFKREYLEFDQKMRNNAFLGDRAQQEQERLVRKQHELEELAARTQEELAREQMKISQQLSDTIISNLKIYNQSKKYQVIFSNAGTDNIILADEVYNITNEVIDFLNKKYVPSDK